MAPPRDLDGATSGIGESLGAASDSTTVDRLNAGFYGEIQYPWPPQSFDRVVQPDFWARMLAQDVGFRSTPVVAVDSEIWVAGCGTNQAVMTALRFPHARVTGSDLSEQSLEVAGRNARQLGITNLELKRESINEAAYRARFDYVLCTGVIHHNVDPRATLCRLMPALRPAGVLELMVYNRFHRVMTAAFQTGLRMLLGNPALPDLRRELPVARQLVAALPPGHALAKLADEDARLPDAAFADALLQPVEHSYTIESLNSMAQACGLELLGFCIDSMSRANGSLTWNLEIAGPELQAAYGALPDVDRWQITNLLLGEHSPMLWFYLQRRDSPIARRTEHQAIDELLRHRFVRTRTEKELFIRTTAGGFARAPGRVAFPQVRALREDAARVYAELDEHQPFRHTMQRLAIEPTFTALHRLRIALTTSAFPYLAVNEATEH
jgi:SAM-dependent methyltransferase